jgi:hypothetical protein
LNPETEGVDVRKSSKVVLTLALGVSASLGYAMSSFGDQSYRSADPNESTYSLTGLSLNGALESGDNRNQVVVSYTTDWAGDAWPGYAECQIRVLDGGGSIIGIQQFQRSQFLPHPVQGLIEVDLGQNAVQEAKGVEGDCAKAEKPPETAGYMLTNMRMAGSGDDPTLTFDVNWTTSEPPLYHECDTVLRFDDGSTKSLTFGISLPDGDTGHIGVSPATALGTPESVECHPYEGRR